MNAPDPNPPARHAPLALWRAAEAFMHTLCNLFGSPEDVAADHTLTRKAYDILLSWLRCAEAMLRRLLLIEAAAYVPPASSRQPAGKMPAVRVRKLHLFTHDKPEAWRVSFRCFRVADRRLPAGIPAFQRAQAGEDLETACRLEAGGPKPKRFFSAWPLAERYEALVRVFNNPAPYARRLAARLRAQTHRLNQILSAPPEAQHRIDCWEALTHAAEVRWRTELTPLLPRGEGVGG